MARGRPRVVLLHRVVTQYNLYYCDHVFTYCEVVYILAARRRFRSVDSRSNIMAGLIIELNDLAYVNVLILSKRLDALIQ